MHFINAAEAFESVGIFARAWQAKRPGAPLASALQVRGAAHSCAVGLATGPQPARMLEPCHVRNPCCCCWCALTGLWLHGAPRGSRPGRVCWWLRHAVVGREGQAGQRRRRGRCVYATRKGWRREGWMGVCARACAHGVRWRTGPLPPACARAHPRAVRTPLLPAGPDAVRMPLEADWDRIASLACMDPLVLRCCTELDAQGYSEEVRAAACACASTGAARCWLAAAQPCGGSSVCHAPPCIALSALLPLLTLAAGRLCARACVRPRR